jgi:hypothetical protein
MRHRTTPKQLLVYSWTQGLMLTFCRAEREADFPISNPGPSLISQKSCNVVARVVSWRIILLVFNQDYQLKATGR